MKMRKILAGLISLALVLTVGAAKVSAQMPPMPGSLAIAVDFTYVDVDNTNFGFVKNFSWANSNTGWNKTFGKKSVIDSGNAVAGTDSDTTLNSSSTTGSLTDTQAGPIAVNFESGLGGAGESFGTLGGPSLMWWLMMHNPIAVAADIKYIDVDNFNMGMVGNKSFAMANSGMNVTNGKKSTIDTGKATASTKTTTDLNSNLTDITVTDTGLVGPVAANVDFDYGLKGMAGFGSLAAAVEADVVLVDNFNFGTVSNFSMSAANTGWNDTNGKKSTIDTGKATASTSTDTTLNRNSTLVTLADTGFIGPVAGNVNVDFGIGVGANCGPSLFGDVALAADVNAVWVDSVNMGFVYNGSVAMANSGGNDTYGKEKSGITTGGAVASTTTTSAVNSNSTQVAISDRSSGPIAGNVYLDLRGCSSVAGVGCADTSTVGAVGPVAVNVGALGGTAIAVDANVALVDNTNFGTVINNSSANANTGLNDTYGEESTVNTGAAAASTATTSTVNTNDTSVAINDGTGIGPVAANVESANSTAIAVEVTVASVENNNVGTVINNSNASANTGSSTTGGIPSVCCDCGGDSGSSITTGSATATTTTTNTVNTNTTSFVINQ